MINESNYIYGLIVVAILAISVMIKYRNKKIRGEWILAAFSIGILSLPIGLYLTPLIEIILRLFLPEAGLSQIFSILLILVMLTICYTYLKKESPTFFKKILAVSFLVLLIAFVVWFEIGAYQHEYGRAISIKQFDAPEGEVARLTVDELKGYPALLRASNKEGCTKSEISNESWYCTVDPEEWGPTMDFIGKKRQESRYLFSITGMELEVEPNKRNVVPAKLKEIFETNNISLSENAIILAGGPGSERWDIIEMQYLFNITDADLEWELNKIEEPKEANIIKLTSAFESGGILLSENHRVLRMEENWIVIDNGGLVYEIWNEGGKLNVYTQETRPYEIQKEEGILKVYRGPDTSGNILFQINEKYYEIGFMME